MHSFWSSLEAGLLAYLLNSLWQVPLLFAAAWLAARALRLTGTAVEHRAWVAALVLGSLLPACFLLPIASLRRFFIWSAAAQSNGDAHVSVVMGPSSVSAAVHLPQALLPVLAIAYGSVCAYLLARLLWRSRKLAELRRSAIELPLTGEAAQCWERCSQQFGVRGAVFAASRLIAGPVTIGMRRKLVLVPAALVPTLLAGDITTVLAHEFAHMRRNDFLKNLFYELIALPVTYHPLFWLTRERVIETREMVCDQMAAESAGSAEYARSLLRLASMLVEGARVRVPHAIGIFDANTFERRIMKLAGKKHEIQGLRRMVIVAACTALGVGTCGSALALRMSVDTNTAAAPIASSDGSGHAPLNVPSGVMAGNAENRVQPKYPDAAKKAKIEGVVALKAMIGKDGKIEDLNVASGPEELRASALDAVRQWTYKPYLLNGDPVEVKTTINITYSLEK